MRRFLPLLFIATAALAQSRSRAVAPPLSQAVAPDFLVKVDANTMIVGDPKVGDRVNVVGELTATGFSASSITKVP